MKSIDNTAGRRAFPRRAAAASAALALAVSALAATAASAASDGIARPPGANPQHRGYELVSLPDAFGSSMYAGLDVTSIRRPPAVARAGGRAFVTSILPIPGQPDAGLESSFTAVRTATGWQRSYNGLPPRRSAFDGVAYPMSWTPDFATILWQVNGLQPDPTDPTQAVDGGGFAHGLVRQTVGQPFQELLRGPAYSSPADNPGTGNGVLSDDGRIVTFTMSGDASLLAGWPAHTIYQRIGDGPLEAISTLPDGSPSAGATLLGVSPDGATTLYMGGGGATTGLLSRTGRGVPIFVDRERGVAPVVPRTGDAFVGASEDLRTVYFLTADALLPTDTDTSADLYRWTAGDDQLTLVSAAQGSGGNGDGTDCPSPLPTTQLSYTPVTCDVAFVGTDRAGDTAYFLSPERLDAAGAGVPGKANLYERRAGSPDVRLVAALDSGEQVPSNLLANHYDKSFSVADEGALLYRSLRNPETGTDDAFSQVRRFDPTTGHSQCVSCNQQGADTAAGTLQTPVDNTSDLVQDNATADGRHVFFETRQRLVPEDRNAAIDVYDYDAQTGQQSLISPGTSADDSLMAGVSADGADVMFATRDTLDATDVNGPVIKLYDARRDGGFPGAAVAGLPCREDGCRAGATAPPAVTPPASVGPSPDGNVVEARPPTWSAATATSTALHSAARTGRLTLKVKVSGPGTVRVAASATVAGAVRVVGKATKKAVRPGTVSLTLTLTASARRTLRAKGRLRVSLATTIAGVAGRKTAAVTLTAASTTSPKGR